MSRYVARPELAEAKVRGFHDIGEASAATGLSPKMIRRYEKVGLVPVAGRTFAGYRLYAKADLVRLRFVKRSRTLGFSIKQIADLLQLWGDSNRPSAQVKEMAQAHAVELQARIAQMQAMQDILEELAGSCQGNLLPHCPILDDLAGCSRGRPS